MGDSDNKNTGKSKRQKFLSIIFVTVLLISPLIYLYYRIHHVNSVQNQEDKQSKVQDITVLENLVKTNPGFDNLINLSAAYINNKQPGKSIDYLKSAITLNPNSAVAYNNLGAAYIMLEQFQNGIDACSKALEINPEFQLAKNNCRWGKDEKEKILLAIELQEKTSKEKMNVEFYIDYGFNYFKIGNYDKSIELWRLVLNLDSKNTKALNNIGTAFVLKFQYDDAIQFFNKAIALEPDNQLAKNNLAWAMAEKGKMSAHK